ncbi:uncharacterized protein BYT42DRAFT_613583 [Radiomyces spectabilis]|uniref:uncharacterized protein n=1 Tax=Radiomyces spectabilis TaxID=64574 RepID=UPI00221F2B96|nr:uncharacterized protein BYT42DRAFT_613583 [Radiomyces spectabilis]KAI8379253.1 hypothetical protein BYT42DRAFT_613583 [Radiomyces spectabilis]
MLNAESGSTVVIRTPAESSSSAASLTQQNKPSSKKPRSRRSRPHAANSKKPSDVVTTAQNQDQATENRSSTVAEQVIADNVNQTNDTAPKKRRRPRHHKKKPATDTNTDASGPSATEPATSSEASTIPAKPKPKPKPKPKSTALDSSDQTNNATHSPRFHKNRAQARLTSDATPQEASNDGPEAAKPKRSRRKPAKAPTQTLPTPDFKDLASSIAHELQTGAYECMVCWDIIRHGHHTWTCDCCWKVFHLNCIGRWATKSLEDKSTNKMITSWRCPGCQHTRGAVPRDYLCFCGKERNPEPSKFLIPHSCGQLCKKSRACPHECTLPCHPGPCPPCSAMGPLRTCYCGRNMHQKRCADTDYTTQGYSCDEVCGELLGCGKHRCVERCHSGVCEPCKVDVSQTCYCGRHSRTARCGQGAPTDCNGHIGYYSCKSTCETAYACGNHFCKEECHPCTVNTEQCPFDPAIIDTCPCGAHPLEALMGKDTRTVCTDPILTCSSTCNKLLPCGHACQQRCHTGSCAPCQEPVNVPCRCRATTFSSVCSRVCEAAGGEPPLCDKICPTMRSCGRHGCGNQCCPASKQKGKKKTLDTTHDCTLVCGRTLSCGIHQCQERCHKGKCNPCLEAEFDEVTCHCGRTVLEPPVRCGTKLPPCPYPCTRVAPCGHMRLLQHNCHPDDEPCPPCAILITRSCVCGKAMLKNVPCYREAPRCGQVCDKPLPCQLHRCRRTCHADACLGENEVCTQPCGKSRSCSHPCKAPCHGDSPCPETEPCDARIRATCDCGQNSIEIPCNATAESSGSNQKLDCNDFCLKVQRNRRLAMALDIHRDETTAQQLSTDDLGYYDDSLCGFYHENPSWCKQIETLLIDFVQDSKQSLHCRPMRSAFRRFIHRYCIHFNLATEAVDPEPKRSVIVRKTLGQCRVPSILLSYAAYHPTANRPPAQPVKDSVAEATVMKTSKQPVNALYLSDMAFGMTKSDLDEILRKLYGDVSFTSRWVNDFDAVIMFETDNAMPVSEKEDLIWRLKKGTKMAFFDTHTAARVDCCWINQQDHVTWCEKPLTNNKTTSEAPTSASKNSFNALMDVSDKEDDDDDEWTFVERHTTSQDSAPAEHPIDSHSTDNETDAPVSADIQAGTTSNAEQQGQDIE